MERFSIFCCISMILNVINGDITNSQHSVSIDCYENRLQEINEDLLNKINSLRKPKNLVPLALERHLVSGAVEWARYMAENNKIIRGKKDCKYVEVLVHMRNQGSYFDSERDAIQSWNEWLTPPHGKFSHYPVTRYVYIVEVGQLYWNETKEVGCGACSFYGIKDLQVNWVVACRVRPPYYSVYV